MKCLTYLLEKTRMTGERSDIYRAISRQESTQTDGMAMGTIPCHGQQLKRIQKLQWFYLFLSFALQPHVCLCM